MPKHTAVNGATPGRVAGGVVAEEQATMHQVAPTFSPFTATPDDVSALLDKPGGARLIGAVVGAQQLHANRAFSEVIEARRRRGRPLGSVQAVTKEAVKLRLDADVMPALRATGDGWQTRINDTLRASRVLAGRISD